MQIQRFGLLVSLIPMLFMVTLVICESLSLQTIRRLQMQFLGIWIAEVLE